jgi:hypothetical protein
MKTDYNFGLSGMTVWSMHIFFGLLFIVLGSVYQYYKDKDPEIQKQVGEILSFIVIIIGVLMASYHAHLLALDKGLL